MKKLVIVESPAKVKTISKYLGNDFLVASSKGHIRDLSTKGKYGLGVDIEDHFKPNYVTIKGKSKVVTELKKDVKKADFVYLATDPDREGEAISYHLYEVLGLDENHYDRVVFNEITKNAVTEAFHHPRKIDINLVESQEARRILDRIIGFRLSKLIQSKTDGTSAGRVQSVALKLIVEREEEIQAFQAEEYYTIKAIFPDFEADLVKFKTKKIEIKSELEANDILNKLSKSFEIEDIEKKEKSKKAPLPFITSTLQQAAGNKLGMNAKKTMSIAQKLYEGVDLGEETVGLITYMRTDSTRLSHDFIKEAESYIEAKYGKEYKGSVRQKNSEFSQDAHEAIRPTSIKRDPLSMKPFLTPDEYKLYRIIYYRALASLMSNAKTLNTGVTLNNNDYKFKVNGQTLVFKGYLEVYGEYETLTETELPPFDTYQSNVLVSTDIVKEQHFTEPPSRYTEPKLVAALEELGIGRPSTYAQIVDNIRTRHYVEVVDKKFVPTEVGIEVTKKLQEFFSHIINVEYTANMETDLDKIAEGKEVWYEVLEHFYQDFEPSVQEAFTKMEKKEAEKTGESCPECGNPLVIRKGKYGSFVACSNFPACKYIKNDRKETEICDCPNCDGKIIEKRSKRGKIFYGCNQYPTCKTAYWDKPTGEKCPECGSLLTEKKNKIKCSNCDYEK
ncbi:MAG: type I DNA topoisomerase [Tenericutes bacterium]|nr:type I DNA topoisomerase [Mycoplasmatota bacterium]